MQIPQSDGVRGTSPHARQLSQGDGATSNPGKEGKRKIDARSVKSHVNPRKQAKRRQNRAGGNEDKKSKETVEVLETVHDTKDPRLQSVERPKLRPDSDRLKWRLGAL